MLVLVSSVVLGATDNVVVGAVNLNKPMGVRQLGAAGVGVGNGGVMAMWSNPAFLMDMETKGEISAGGGSMNDGNESLTALGGGWKFSDNWAVGGFFGNNGVNFKEIDGAGQEAGPELNDSTMAFGAVGAYRWKWLTAGGTFKIVNQNLVEQSYMAPCGDLGVAGKWADFTAGISFRNLGGKLIQPDTDENKFFYPDGVSLPAEFRLGGAYTFPAIRLTPAMEFRQTTDRDTIMALSVNWWANNWLALRSGFAGPVGTNKASTTIEYANKVGDDSGNMSFAFGLTALYKAFGLNFGFETAKTGPSARLDLTYAIGERAERQEEAREPEREQPREEVKQAETPAPPPPAGAKKLNFAIADLRGENVSAGDAAVMADLLRNELVKTEQFTVIEKQNMDKVLSEHAFQQTGCSSEECAVKLGKLLNVQRMAVGSFGKLMDSYILSIRVVNVETGAIVYADSAEGEKVSQLRGGVKDMAQRMAKKIR
jgi:hypothetical protein